MANNVCCLTKKVLWLKVIYYDMIKERVVIQKVFVRVFNDAQTPCGICCSLLWIGVGLSLSLEQTLLHELRLRV